jgi:hypothetical protein
MVDTIELRVLHHTPFYSLKGAEISEFSICSELVAIVQRDAVNDTSSPSYTPSPVSPSYQMVRPLNPLIAGANAMVIASAPHYTPLLSDSREFLRLRRTWGCSSTIDHF